MGTKKKNKKKVQHVEKPAIAAEVGRKGDPDIFWVKEYIHYKTGKLMRAEDYGYKAWPFCRKAA